MDQKQIQLKLSEQELERLKDHIWHRFLGARSNHDARIERFRRYWRMWRGLHPDTGRRGENAELDVPMLKWIEFGHWSRCMQAILGDDAEIVAAARTPEAEKLSRKVGLYETWRFFEYMKGINALTPWVFNATLYGRAHAYAPYEQEFYWERADADTVNTKDLDRDRIVWIDNGDGTLDIERLSYDGPQLIPLRFDQIILPAQDNVQSIDEFEWVIRRVRVTPDQLLEGERRGKYQGIRERWTEIKAFAQQRQERDYWLDDAGIEMDKAEGVDHASLMGNRDSLEMWVWYGKWRLPKGKQDSRPENLNRRQPQQSELVVSFLKDPRIIVSVQDLRDLYPRMKKRVPILDIGLVKDGSYWGPGLGELVEDLQLKSTANYKLFEHAGKLSVGPVIFYKSASGFDPETFEYRPNTAIPSEDPNGVRVVTMQADLKFSEMNQQALQGFAEKTTGVSDQTLGQSIDRPNAPRTASGQMALIEQGNVRASLDMYMLREDLSTMLEYIWSLDREYAPESVFFRATEEDANGLFDVKSGFGEISAQEREHNFDFQLKFATSVWSREAKKQGDMALYSMSIQNPLVAQNPKALWVILNMAWKALGNDNFADVVPEPPDLEQPKSPKEEWVEALKGEEVHVNPMDDDRMHVVDHRRRLEQEMQEKPDERDKQAEQIMVAHIMEHEQQIRQKMIMQAIVQRMQQEQQQQQMAGGTQMQPVGQLPVNGPQASASPGPGIQPDQGGAPGGPAGVAAIAGPAGVGGAQG